MVKQQYLLQTSTCSYNMANFSPLTAEIYSGACGTPEISTGFVTAATSLTGNQPNFARCLAVSWAGTLYNYFRRAFAPDEILPGAKFTLRPSCLLLFAALLHGTPAACVSQTLRRGTRNGSTELSQRTPPIFGWAAITMGIGPHSSLIFSSTYFSTSPSRLSRHFATRYGVF